MDPMEVEVEVEKGGLRRSIESDDEEYEFEMCVCTQHTFNEVECYTIKVPDPEAIPPLSYFRPVSFDCLFEGGKKNGEIVFNPKKIVPIFPSVEGPFACRYFAVIGSVLYAVGGKENIRNSCLDDVSEDYDLEGGHLAFMSFIPTRDVWTLDLTCPEQGWKSITPMKYRRLRPQTIVLGGKLYVFGGFHSLYLKDELSSGWMEVYDPKLDSWECLPNPPSHGDTDQIIFAGLESEGEGEIMVGDMKRSWYANFYTYNIGSSSWRKTFVTEGSWVLVHSLIEKGRAAVVDNSLYYWASIVDRDSRECTIYGFNSKTNHWASDILNPCPVLGLTDECLITTGSCLLHLSGQKFCLLLRSCNKSNNHYLYCFVLDLSELFPPLLSDEVFPCHPSEEDDGSRLSVLSIQKYAMDNFTDLLDCLIFNVKSQSQKKRKLKTSLEANTSAEACSTKQVQPLATTTESLPERPGRPDCPAIFSENSKMQVWFEV